MCQSQQVKIHEGIGRHAARGQSACIAIYLCHCCLLLQLQSSCSSCQGKWSRIPVTNQERMADHDSTILYSWRESEETSTIKHPGTQAYLGGDVTALQGTTEWFKCVDYSNCVEFVTNLLTRSHRSRWYAVDQKPPMCFSDRCNASKEEQHPSTQPGCTQQPYAQRLKEGLHPQRRASTPCAPTR